MSQSDHQPRLTPEYPPEAFRGTSGGRPRLGGRLTERTGSELNKDNLFVGNARCSGKGKPLSLADAETVWYELMVTVVRVVCAPGSG